MPTSYDRLMQRVLVEFGGTNITEAMITEPGWHIGGVCDGKYVAINPAPAVCLLVIHELLHKINGEWPEEYVKNRATFLRDRMSAEEQWALYSEYLKKRRRRKTALKVETE